MAVLSVMWDHTRNLSGFSPALTFDPTGTVRARCRGLDYKYNDRAPAPVVAGRRSAP